MKNVLKLLPLVLVASLTACENTNYVSDTLLLFGTTVSVTMVVENHFNGGKTYSEIKSILKKCDELADVTKQREATNVWSLNQTNEKLEISEELYNMLKTAKELQQSLEYFNPLIGSLSNKWKNSLNLRKDMDHEPAVLSDEIIQEELAKINSSELIIEETKQGYFAQRVGEAQIDLGAIAKGYSLDQCTHYLNNHTGDTEQYLINAGFSSLLLGENWKKDGFSSNRIYDFTVDITDVPSAYFYARNCVVSTSGISEQSATINGVTYSHIINPKTGKAVTENDSVIVITPHEKACLGDALSTSMMMNSIDEIKEIEKKLDIKAIVIKDKQVVYNNPEITIH